MTHTLARAWLAAAVAVGAALLAGCGGEKPAAETQQGDVPEAAEGSANAPTDPPGAQRPLLELLRESAAQVPHPADGGGRAWLESAEGDPPVTTRSPARFVLHYEVGELGIATGGMIFLQVSPFWGWSTPQVEEPEAPGFTTVEASSDDIGIAAATFDEQLLGIEVTGRPLVAGDGLTIVYGAGPAGAITDRYAEKNSRFWFGVDGDGDGQRAFLADSPGVDVAPGPPAQMMVLVPTTAHPGERVRVTLAILDASGNAGPKFSGDVRFPDLPAAIEMPASLRFEAGDGAARSVEAVVREVGTFRLEAVADGGIAATSNPLVVSEGGPQVLWADLHGHTAVSDGTGTVADYFRYARDVAALDVVALTDHDHWGMLPLDSHPEFWEENVREVRRVNEPGRFVTLLGFEWTSWIYGHRHVLYFDDDGDVKSSIAPEYESPLQLWKSLAGKRALTFAHHSAGGPIPTDWSIPPDPEFEPVTEIVSVHGSSEALDSPMPIYSPVRGNFVRDVLDRGYRLGFVGSGDSHDGHPGLAHLAAPSGGLAAILSEDRTRDGVLQALRERRVYASNGPRILLRAAIGSHGMGAIVHVPTGETFSDELFVHAVTPAPIERVDLIRSGEIVDSIAVDGLSEVLLRRPVEGLRAGEYVYVRVVQIDSGAAWSSPIFFE